MASIRITITTDNAAFHDEDVEVARLLDRVLAYLKLHGSPAIDGMVLRVVGKVEVLSATETREETEERASWMNLKIALGRLYEAANGLRQEAFDTTSNLRSAWVHAGQVLKQEGG